MAVEEKWKWQEPGTTWKGVGLYHITLTITDRLPLLGTLTIPNNDPTMAKVNRTTLGNALVDFYSKCGMLDTTRRIFDEMPQKSVIS